MTFKHFDELPESSINEKFYCNVCDRSEVDSCDRKTGTFFMSRWGHVWGGSATSKPVSEQYCAVVYAICNDCLEDQNQK